MLCDKDTDDMVDAVGADGADDECMHMEASACRLRDDLDDAIVPNNLRTDMDSVFQEKSWECVHEALQAVDAPPAESEYVWLAIAGANEWGARRGVEPQLFKLSNETQALLPKVETLKKDQRTDGLVQRYRGTSLIRNRPPP